MAEAEAEEDGEEDREGDGEARSMRPWTSSLDEGDRRGEAVMASTNTFAFFCLWPLPAG